MSKIFDYIENRMEELINDEECAPIGEYIPTVVQEVKEKFNTQCIYENCGDFDSPGYDLICYGIAFLNENNELEIIDYQEERY